jgi:hypothetical protein
LGDGDVSYGAFSCGAIRDKYKRLEVRYLLNKYGAFPPK